MNHVQLYDKKVFQGNPMSFSTFSQDNTKICNVHFPRETQEKFSACEFLSTAVTILLYQLYPITLKLIISKSNDLLLIFNPAEYSAEIVPSIQSLN